mgnify:CR=1 FL=1|jgi:hypothetical protein
MGDFGDEATELSSLGQDFVCVSALDSAGFGASLAEKILSTLCSGRVSMYSVAANFLSVVEVFVSILEKMY